MTKNIDIKKTIIRCLSCLLLVCSICFLTNDAWAANAGCTESNKCFPGCKYNQVDSCTLCPVFVLVFNTVSKVGSLSAENFSGGIINVVVVAFAIWLAIETVKFVSSMKTKDLKDFVQAIITKGFVVLVVIMILKTGVGNFYNIFIQPVYNTAQSMSQIMFKDGTGIGGNKSDKTAQNDKSIADIKEIKNGLPSSIGASIVKTMTMMENRVRKLNALGAGMLCQSWQDRWFIFPLPRYFIFGLAVWVLTVAIIIMVPFIMIDSVFQLGVATALMPFAVGAYAFDYTKKKLCNNVWDTFLNSAFSFLFTSVVVLILLGAIQSATQSGIGGISGFDEMFVVGSSTGDNTFAKFKETVSWGSGAFLNLFFIFLLAWSVMNMGVEFAKEFAGSISSTSIGKELGGKAGSMASNAATKLTAPARTALKKGVKSFAGRVGRGLKHAGRKGVSMVKKRNFDRKAQAAGATVAGGVISFTDKDGSLMSKDENGNITRTLNSEKMGKNGTKTVTQNKEIRTKNAILRVQTVTTMKQNANGGWDIVDTKSSEQMKALSEKVEGIMGKDGKCDFQKMEKLLEGTSGETKNALRGCALRKMTESRFANAFDPSKAKLKGPAETTMDKDGNVVTKYTLADGGVVFAGTKMRADGLVESTLSRVGKDGSVMTLQTDGVRNKFSASKLKEGTDISGLGSIGDIRGNCETDEKGRVKERVGYSYTDYYQQRMASGAMRAGDVPDGMFFQKDKDGITRDEYGEVVRDAKGNAKGGAFARYMRNASNPLFRDEGTGNQSKNGGYTLTKSDMGFFFGGSGSGRSKSGIFG